MGAGLRQGHPQEPVWGKNYQKSSLETKTSESFYGTGPEAGTSTEAGMGENLLKEQA